MSSHHHHRNEEVMSISLRKVRLTIAAVLELLRVWITVGAIAAPPAGLQTTDLFVGGKDGYYSYRIPALVVSKQGTLLAFCEGRKESTRDDGNIDTLVKRSTDNGQTWSRQQVIWHEQGNTCGNPCAVIDFHTGNVWLLMTWNRGDENLFPIIAQTSKDTRRV